MLREYGYQEAVVTQPTERSKQKTDSRDAGALSHLLRGHRQQFLNRREASAWAAASPAADTGFSANLFTIVSDTVPRKAVSSVVGIGGTAGCVGMLVFSTLIGWILHWTQAAYGEKDYLIPFLMAASAYLVATAGIQLLLPRLEPMSFEINEGK